MVMGSFGTWVNTQGSRFPSNPIIHNKGTLIPDLSFNKETPT